MAPADPPAPPGPPARDESAAPTDTLAAVDRDAGLHLVVFSRDGAKVHKVPPERSVTVGRSQECDVVVEGAALSRKHFSVKEGQPPTVTDLGSANGTKVNGARLAAHARTPVELGNLIEAGGVFFMLQDHDPHGAFARAPAPVHGEPPTVRASEMRAVVVEDAAMARLYQLVDLVARSDIPVLVLGETGVGKEVVSAQVHKQSARADKPYVRLNCAALPETLLESELFGYEKGAFTGATQAKQGLIETADGGTLFLDEIGEIPPATQSKLLRVLENGELIRLGALKPRVVDVRFIAATNRNLAALVAKGTFRRDLYYRLNGITIPIPPLRDRVSEIPGLARMFLAQAAKRAARPAPALTPEVLERLSRHSWPGNIRELRNVMDRVMTLCLGDVVRPEHLILDPEVPEERPISSTPTATNPPSQPDRPSGRLMRMDPDTERQLILQALDQAGGNQSKASEILGISRRTLINRLDEYGLKRPRKGGR